MWFYLHEIARRGKFTDREQMVAARGWGEGEWGVSVPWGRVLVWGDAKSLEKDGGSGCTTLRMCYTPLS